jgi:plastocyanin
MGMKRLASLLAAAVLAAAVLPAAAQGVVEVRIEKYQFVPAEVRVKPGTTVKWINDEKRTSHSVLFKGEGGFESERMFPGESWERRFDRPGSYPYTCGPHPEMSGVVEVAE